MTEVLVLGAGMVGVGAALELQKRGHDVTLVERRVPGDETSFGNAGLIQAEAVEPYAIPQDLPSLIRYALGFTNDVVFDWKGLLEMTPSLWRYFRNSSVSRHRAISKVYAQLALRSTRDHAPWIDAAGAQDLIRHDGFYKAFRTQATFDEGAEDARRMEQTYGIKISVLDSDKFASAEPDLKKKISGAVLWHDAWACTDPGGLTKAYAKLFTEQGGTLVAGDAMTLRDSSMGWRVETQDGPVTASQVVVALGPWSPDLVRQFGYDIPMVYKRGYHGHYQSTTHLNRPIMDYANGIVMSPMTRGMRLATGAALVDRDAPARPVQLDRGAKAVSDLIDLGPRVNEPQWFGHRPCMPDMLPLVGPAPNHKGLWFNFGHGHQGFTLGPTTGLLLAGAMEGHPDPIMSALSPETRMARHFRP